MVKTRLGEFDSSGRRRPIDTDEVRVVSCNSVILAVGEERGQAISTARPAWPSRKAACSKSIATRWRPAARTFYAGGDLITGASNVTNAMGYGKEAARNIDRDLTGESRFDSILPTFQYGQTPPDPTEQLAATIAHDPAGGGPRQDLRGSHLGAAARGGA